MRVCRAHPSDLFLKRYAFFKQGQFDFVVVIAGSKAAECEHEGLQLRDKGSRLAHGPGPKSHQDAYQVHPVLLTLPSMGPRSSVP
jgi:hypothetical protein